MWLRNRSCRSNLACLMLLASALPALAAAPIITNQPASQTIFFGDPVSFRVGASGTAPLAFQWYRDGAALSAATTSVYTILSVSSNDHGAGFRVVVTNSSGAATSSMALLTVDPGVAGPAQVTRLFGYTNIWRYDQVENLDGINWPAINYDDRAWPAGPGLLAYENNGAINPLTNTWLANPQFSGGDISPAHAYYFRTSVNITSDFSAYTLTYRCDDGVVMYTNGAEALRVRMPLQGAISNLTFATGFPPDSSGGTDATIDEQTTVPWQLPRGTNVIAVSVHQANSGSSDIVWGMALDGISYTRVRDTNAPILSEIIPTPGSTVPVLNEIEVHFSEGVKGVRAADLLVNGSPATKVTLYAPDIYIFNFPQPPPGQVQVVWSAGQNITDLSANSNRFAGGSYSYTLDPLATAGSVRINEIMADNSRTIRDEDGHYSDWIELYNSGDQPVNIGRWYLTDDPAKLTKWQFPLGVTLQARGYLLVWASGLDRTNAAAPLHTNFKLSKNAGSYLGLVHSEGVTLISSFWPYPQQYADVSYGRDRLDPSLLGYFTNATPGMANATLGPGIGPEVQFSVTSRTFTQPFTLTLSCVDPTAVIRYVMVSNGTQAAVTNVPNASSPVYTGPLTISGSTQVRARSFPLQPNYFPGPAHNETYYQIATAIAGFSSDLPIVVFHNMGGGAVAYSADQFMTTQVFDTRNGRSSLLNPPDVATQGYFHRRGQATIGNPKANLRVETQDAYGDDLKLELLGMPAESDWVFYGIDCFDKVLMHNPLAHELYREMGHYTSRCRYVEVYLKDDSGTPGPITAADYNGLYVLEEKIKIGKNRVDIDKLQDENTNAPSVTGGYLLSIDKSNPGSPEYLADAAIWYLDPDYYEITSPVRVPQREYIDNYFNDFYAALTGPNWTDPATGYAAYIDLNSWMDCHLQSTFVFNVDMLRISSYFYKPRGGKIVQGPLWDFDRAFADSSDSRGFNPRLWRSVSPDYGTDPFNPGNTFNNPWYSVLFTDPDFWQRWIDRYQELRKSVYSLTNLYARIDYFGNQVREATSREYARWTGSGGSDTSPRSGTQCADGLCYTFPSPGTWQGEINFTKYWFSNRVDFMDSEFLNPPIFSASGGMISPGFVLTVNAQTREANSTIYYTTNGTDPRLPGGGISPAAFTSLNTASIRLTNNARIFARNYNSAHQNQTGPNCPPLSSPWSGPTVGTFIVATPTLAITEIMYNPARPAAGTNDNDSFEFIELKNVGTRSLSLPGFRFTNGIDFTFTTTNAVTTLGPGQYCVLVSDLAAFRSRYPEVTNVAGQYTNKLNNGGERLVLEGPLKEPVLDFRFENTWYPATDGAGLSLVVRNEYGAFNTWTNSASWRPSAAVGGSPGRADPNPVDVVPVVINEVLTHTDLPQVDAIELYNPGSTPAPIGGWFITDDRQQPLKYCIPTNTVIAARGYAVFDSTQFGTGSNAFALSSLGEQVYLFAGDGTNITGYCQGANFGAQHNGVTFGRVVTSDGKEHLVTQRANTLGKANAGPRVGPVVINEIMYAPTPFGLDPDNVDEYIELRNVSGNTVPLYDPLHPTNAFRLDGAVQYEFPSQTTMPPWSYLLLVSFDPGHDPASLAWFRGRYGLGTNVTILGPWQGHLGNQGERIALYEPDKPELPPSPIAGFVPQVLVEEINYSPLPPWPAGTDSTGKSLQRIGTLAFGDEPTNWCSAAPSPGSINPASLNADSDHDGLPDEWELANGLDPMDPTGNNGADGDPDEDGMTNGQEYLAGTNPMLAASNFRLEFSLQSGAATLSFLAVANRAYTLLSTVDLVNPTWTAVTNIAAGTFDRVVQIPVSATGQAAFYRVVTPSQP